MWLFYVIPAYILRSIKHICMYTQTQMTSLCTLTDECLISHTNLKYIFCIQKIKPIISHYHNVLLFSEIFFYLINFFCNTKYYCYFIYIILIHLIKNMISDLLWNKTKADVLNRFREIHPYILYRNMCLCYIAEAVGSMCGLRPSHTRQKRIIGGENSLR